jgi:hypothetical protein
MQKPGRIPVKLEKLMPFTIKRLVPDLRLKKAMERKLVVAELPLKIKK